MVACCYRAPRQNFFRFDAPSAALVRVSGPCLCFLESIAHDGHQALPTALCTALVVGSEQSPHYPVGTKNPVGVAGPALKPTRLIGLTGRVGGETSTPLHDQQAPSLWHSRVPEDCSRAADYLVWFRVLGCTDMPGLRSSFVSFDASRTRDGPPLHSFDQQLLDDWGWPVLPNPFICVLGLEDPA